MGKPLLCVHDLSAALETGQEVLGGIDLEIGRGEIHVIMGPNGSGKSTLANTIMGSPVYTRTRGRIVFDGEDITAEAVDVRAKKGIFLAFQNPEEIDGITVSDFLRTVQISARGAGMSFTSFRNELKEALDALQLDESYAARYLNVGFSGGEKKKSEILQLLILNPTLAILDETDSGLDVDAVQVVTEGILRYKSAHNALLIISHSTRLLDALPVDKVHILQNGRFVHTGDRSVIDEINANGFARFSPATAR